MASAVVASMMQSINKFFDNKVYFTLMNNIINHQDEISLRLLEFMFTKYSKRQQVVLIINNDPIFLCDLYADGLESYGKARYDCFKRHERVIFTKHGIDLETTVGQLQFFKHIIPTGAIDFARKNYEDIRTEMASYVKGQARRKTKGAAQAVDFVMRM